MYLSSGVCGDPCVLFDESGNGFFAHLSYPVEGHWLDRIVIQKSTDGGVTWSDGTYTGWDASRNMDKEWLAVDRSDSPYRNSIYVCWTAFDSYGSENPDCQSWIMFSRSWDAGEHWTDMKIISDIPGDCRDSDDTMEGAVPAVGPDGEIYVAWSGFSTIWFDRSFDGGDTFGEDIIISDQPGGWDFDVSGISRCNGLPVVACDISDSPYRNTVYVVWSDQREGINDTDIFLAKSLDGGETWSSPIRVNDDDSGRHQFFCWMDVDASTGDIYIVFYDRRNTTGDETDVFVARSTDGGMSFDNFKVSETSFNPDPDVFFGDYINIACHDGTAHPIWMRMDGGKMSVWTAIIRMDGATPTPMQSPTPFVTPTALPTPGNGIQLCLSKRRFTAGDRFYFFCYISNETSSGEWIDEYIVLDIHGEYWCWPSWRPLKAAVDFEREYLPAGTHFRKDILDFTWPEGCGADTDLRFWGAAVSVNSGEIFGRVDMVSWDYD